jgi:hypothetical protein
VVPPHELSGLTTPVGVPVDEEEEEVEDDADDFETEEEVEELVVNDCTEQVPKAD